MTCGAHNCGAPSYFAKKCADSASPRFLLVTLPVSEEFIISSRRERGRLFALFILPIGRLGESILQVYLSLTGGVSNGIIGVHNFFVSPQRNCSQPDFPPHSCLRSLFLAIDAIARGGNLFRSVEGNANGRGHNCEKVNRVADNLHWGPVHVL